jgi:hypothetical protein
MEDSLFKILEEMPNRKMSFCLVFQEKKNAKIVFHLKNNAVN